MRSLFCLVVILEIFLGLVAGPAAWAAPAKGPPRTETAPPLVVAAWKADHREIEALLDAGENPDSALPIGLTSWMFSLIARDRTGFRMLFDSVRDFRPADPMTVYMFLFQVAADERDLVGELIGRGVSANAVANDGTSALMLAAANGHAEMVTLLLDRGADVNLVDRHGDTALMSAVRAGCLACTKTLLARRAQVDQRDRAGNRAMSYALRTGRPDVQRLLREAGAQPESGVANAPAPADPQMAVGRSLPLLERVSTEWMDSRGCNACHLQPMMLKVNAVARAQGFPVGTGMLDSLEKSLREEFGPHFGKFASQALETDEGVTIASLHVGGDQAFSLALAFSSALDAGIRRPAYDQSSVMLLARMQQPDGSWRHGPDRVPMQSNPITSTALAARVLEANAKENRQQDYAGRVARARAWLEASVPKTTDDAAFRLLGLRWLGSDPALIAQAGASLARRQLGSGGWSQVDGLNADAYATGLALVALHEGGGMRGSDPAYRRGVAYLLATQYADGSWLVHKRAVPVNRYFESGFPHGKFQFTSFLGTAWATMALMYSQPDKRGLAARKDQDFQSTLQVK